MQRRDDSVSVQCISKCGFVKRNIINPFYRIDRYSGSNGSK